MRKLIAISTILLLYTNSALCASFTSGRQTTTDGTPVQLSTTSTPCKRVVISALEDNTDVVVIGDSGVDVTTATREGLLLFPGQTEYINPVHGTNLVAIWLDVEVDNEGVQFLCIDT